MKDDRRDRAGVAEGGTPAGTLVDEAIARFEEEHDRIVIELGAYLGLFARTSGGGSATKQPGDPEEIRTRVASWCSDQCRRGSLPRDVLLGLAMAVRSFSDDQLMIFVDGLVAEAHIRLERDAVVAGLPRLR